MGDNSPGKGKRLGFKIIAVIFFFEALLLRFWVFICCISMYMIVFYIKYIKVMVCSCVGEEHNYNLFIA